MSRGLIAVLAALTLAGCNQIFRIHEAVLDDAGVDAGSGGNPGSGGIGGGSGGTGGSGLGSGGGGGAKGSGGFIGAGGVATGSGGSPAGSGGASGGSGGAKGSGGIIGAGGVAAGSGGNPGSGGVTYGPCTITATDSLIADMEENGGKIGSGCLVGAWYTARDPSPGASISPPAADAGGVFTYDSTPGECHAGKCAKVVAAGFARNAIDTYSGYWGWQESLNLNQPSSTQRFYVDASTKNGISFWAKSDSYLPTAIEIATACSTSNVWPGGTCFTTSTVTSCDQGFFYYLTLTPTWTQYQIPWASFAQPTPTAAHNSCTDKTTRILTLSFKHLNGDSGFTTDPILDGVIYVDDLHWM